MNEVDLAARKGLIVEAASSVFLRYGYARTTMADLAAAAKVSRPTLYEVFPGKDDLFDKVIRKLNEETIEDYRRLLPKLRTVKTRLHHFCGDWALHGIRLAQQHPDAKDLFDLQVPAVREMYESFVQFLVEAVRSVPHTSKYGLHPTLRNLVFSLRGLKDAAQDAEQMQELVRLQVDIFLELLSTND